MNSMTFKYTNLGAIIDIVIDYRGKTPLKLGGNWEESAINNYRAFSAKNIKTGKIVQLDEIRYVNYGLYKKWMKTEINRGDILITSEAPFGQVYLWNSDEKIVLSQRLFAIRMKPIFDKFYCYYYLISAPFQAEMKARSTGSTVEGLRQPALMKCNFAYPDYAIQKKIGRLLSNYDSLIENNNKRINLLENIAEKLYKEWFVHFRYPGYKNDVFISTQTKGWSYGKSTSICPKTFKICELSEIANFKRGKNITAAEMLEGNIPVISAGLQPSGYHNDYNVKGKSITVSASGANAGYLSYHLENIWAADCSYCQSEYLWFIYNALKFLQPVITNLQCGSAQPHVYAKNLNRLNLILPTDTNIIKKYNDLVSPLYEEIKILNNKNNNLVKQRDALLPRLMSGKLSVEGKEIL